MKLDFFKNTFILFCITIAATNTAYSQPYSRQRQFQNRMMANILTKMGVPAVYVMSGEGEQVEGDSWVPEYSGGYHVSNASTGEYLGHCYHSTDAGKVIAWSQIKKEVYKGIIEIDQKEIDLFKKLNSKKKDFAELVSKIQELNIFISELLGEDIFRIHFTSKLNKLDPNIAKFLNKIPSQKYPQIIESFINYIIDSLNETKEISIRIESLMDSKSDDFVQTFRLFPMAKKMQIIYLEGDDCINKENKAELVLNKIGKTDSMIIGLKNQTNDNESAYSISFEEINID